MKVISNKLKIRMLERFCGGKALTTTVRKEIHVSSKDATTNLNAIIENKDGETSNWLKTGPEIKSRKGYQWNTNEFCIVRKWRKQCKIPVEERAGTLLTERELATLLGRPLEELQELLQFDNLKDIRKTEAKRTLAKDKPSIPVVKASLASNLFKTFLLKNITARLDTLTIPQLESMFENLNA